MILIFASATGTVVETKTKVSQVLKSKESPTSTSKDVRPGISFKYTKANLKIMQGSYPDLMLVKRVEMLNVLISKWHSRTRSIPPFHGDLDLTTVSPLTFTQVSALLQKWKNSSQHQTRRSICYSHWWKSLTRLRYFFRSINGITPNVGEKTSATWMSRTQ